MRDRPYLLRFVAVVLLLYSLVSLSAAMARVRRAEAALAALEEQCAALEREKLLLSARLERGLTPEEIADLARERLGLVFPGERIFFFVE